MREDRSLSGVKMAGREGQKYSMREFSGVTELLSLDCGMTMHMLELRLRIAKTIWKNEVEGHVLPDIMTCSISLVIILDYWFKGK